MAVATATARISQAQYWIQDDVLDVTASMYAGGTGLVSAHGAVAIILTGTEHGRIRLTVDARAADPGPPGAGQVSWTDVVEVSLVFANGLARVTADAGTPVPGLPPLCAAGPGPYRVRVHARGRDRARRAAGLGQPQDLLEEHLIIAWPAAERPEMSYRLTDSYGAKIRAQTGSMS